ncbi:MAG TPA: hypothetical protein VEK07_08670 [Polyangiaceae bacterium]|nr:hypothetical protein [Polyangiaceae bacterium]
MPARPIVRGSFGAVLASAVAWALACKGPQKILGPIECADPCCGGNGQVDCEVNPNVDCVEDADICTARSYGCSNGSEYQGLIPPNRPLSCSDDGGLGDAVTAELPDGFDSLLAQLGDDGASLYEASADAGDGAMDAADEEALP